MYQIRLSPLGTSGTVNSGGGLVLTQVLPTSTTVPPAPPPITTKITLGSIGVDLSAKTASVEVVGESNAKEPDGKMPLNVGKLGRSSIADLTRAERPIFEVRVKGDSSDFARKLQALGWRNRTSFEDGIAATEKERGT